MGRGRGHGRAPRSRLDAKADFSQLALDRLGVIALQFDAVFLAFHRATCSAGGLKLCQQCGQIIGSGGQAIDRRDRAPAFASFQRHAGGLLVRRQACSLALPHLLRCRLVGFGALAFGR